MAKSVYEKFGKPNIGGSTESGRRYKIKGGDTLPFIAAEMYPDEGYSSEAWRQIWEVNADLIEDVDDLPVNTVIVIPSLAPTDT